MEINSIHYWQMRFKENWKQSQGKEQTAFLAHILCGLLPNWLTEEIREQKYTICDCGCAEGDAVAVYNQFFDVPIDGFDFSEEAINQAKQGYSDNHFYVQDLKTENPLQKYDMAICSNVLEHFETPWEMAHNLCKIAIRYVLILIPYQESMDIDEHVVRFDTPNIPAFLSDFSLVYAAGADGGEIENTLYGNQQILLIYQKSEDVNFNSIMLENFAAHIRNREHSDLKERYLIKSAEYEQMQEKLVLQENNFAQEKERLENVHAQVTAQMQAELAKEQIKYQEVCSRLFGVEKELENEALNHQNALQMITCLQAEEKRQKENISLLKEQESNQILQIEYLRNHIYTLQVELERTYSTFSWKMTKPLRIIKKTCQKTFNKAALKNLLRRFYIMTTGSVLGQSIKQFIPKKIKKWCALHLASNTANVYANQACNYDGLEENIEFFCASAKRNNEKILMVFSGVAYVDSEGQRGIRLVHEALQREWKVLFCYWRWDVTVPVIASTESLLQIPIDYLATHFSLLFGEMFQFNNQQVMLIEFPHPLAQNVLSIANCYSWITVYDVIDDWQEFQKKGQAEWYDAKVEHGIAHMVDINIATARKLKDKLVTSYHTDGFSAIIPNGVDPQRMKPAERLVEYDFCEGDLQIGYFGHLTDAWFDWTMLFSLAREYPQWTFHLIGYGAPENLKLPKNIKMYGKMSPDEIPKYAAYWDVAMIPFINCELTLGVNPVKIYEYLQLGLPTVASNMPEIKDFPYTEIAVGAKAFADAIKKMSQVSIDRKTVQAFVNSNTWGERFEYFQNIVTMFNPQNTYKCIFETSEE